MLVRILCHPCCKHQGRQAAFAALQEAWHVLVTCTGACHAALLLAAFGMHFEITDLPLAGIQRKAMPQRGSSWTPRGAPGVHIAMMREACSKLPS